MSRTIVWVDDDNDLLASVVEPLEWAGNRVVRYRTQQEARMALPQIREADLLLLDMILPTGQQEDRMPLHFTGLELLKELRQLGVVTPVIVLTVVSPRSELSSELETLGVVRVMHKPVLPSELKKEVEHVLTA